ncbi:MAG: DUF3575 domain-containing protein [Bacteroidaceae bacterium]|nr:DUF3575 domain-containing protein [Bacteroidaceae bacterium]
MKKLYLILALMVGSVCAKAQMIAVNTNLASDALAIPDLGVEMVIGDRSTIGLNVLGGYHPYGKHAKGLAIQPEYRYWFGGRPMNHHFVGIGGLLASYKAEWKDKIHKGDAAGVGMTFGYVFNLSRRVAVDCHAGLGLVWYHQKVYYPGANGAEMYNHPDAYKSQVGSTIIPTKIGISLMYMFR